MIYIVLKVLEAFAGIGTQRMALRNLGVPHEVVAISEIDKFAIKSYEAIHGKTKNLGDISKIKEEDIPEHDLFTYSFPCQDISLAGYQKGLSQGSKTRSSLLWECKRVIESKKPKYLLMENVKNLVSKKFKADFDRWLEYLESLGYTNYWKVLNAKDYGVPQNRERVFCVSILGEHKGFEFPTGEPLTIRLKDVLEDEVDEKFYLLEERVKQLVWK
ncbi:DNA cytosine methyltransferase [Tuanshanicoccus yangjingiae]|uniref:DNA cytosine methyltransferase n=1 Tax=Aerococcaceae bacterium zg-252 TaxID=2796928 RepID=UPI004064248A